MAFLEMHELYGLGLTDEQSASMSAQMSAASAAAQSASLYSVAQSHIQAQQQAGAAKIAAGQKSPTGGMTAFPASSATTAPSTPKTTKWVSTGERVTEYNNYNDDTPTSGGGRVAEDAGGGGSILTSFARGASSYQPGRITEAVAASRRTSSYLPGASAASILSLPQGTSETTRTILRYGLGITAGLVAVWGASQLVKAWRG